MSGLEGKDIRVRFVKINPVQNMTIFVLDPIPKYLHKDVAKKLMSYDNLYAEQVGFISQSCSTENVVRLDMMGGEFCGNAARSLGAFLVYNNYNISTKSDDQYQLKLECSGLKDLITCDVCNTEKINVFKSKVNMPIPTDICEQSLKVNDICYSIIKVTFPGITHFILNDKDIKNRDEFFSVVKEYMTKNNNDYEAFGIMFYNKDTNYLIPLVYVKDTDSLFWEKSCASGTSALGAALAYQSGKDVQEPIKQPGGSLEVSVEFLNDIRSISISGKVEIIGEGIAYI